MSSLSEGRFQGSSVPSITRVPRRTTLLTGDGVRIEAVYTPCTAGSEGPGGAAPGSTAVVLAHGFTGSADRPALLRTAEVFARRAAVITFSFRGHGRSGGRSTVGDREVLDLAAAVAWARSLGHRRIVTVGFSMGGSVVLRHAALYTAPEAGGSPEGGGREVGDTEGAPGAERVQRRTEAHKAHEGRAGAQSGAYTDVAVAVSAPARWYYRGTAPMRRLHWVVTRPTGRLVGRYGFRTRIHREDWNPVPLSPVEAVPLITAPLLIVHGDRDPYFPVDHPRMLAEAAGDGAELWLEHGMGHAENAAGGELLARIAAWTESA